MALGAKRADVARLILSHAVGVAVGGVLAGVAASLVLTRAMSSMLFEVSATDPITFVAAAVSLVSAALTASYIPARRAMRIDPIRVLRSE